MRILACWKLLLPLLMLLLVVASCKSNERRQANSAGKPGGAVPGISGTEADLLLEGLKSADRPDEQSFALYFISHFELDNYRDQVQELAGAGTALPAVVLSAVYKDNGPLQALLSAGQGVEAFNDVTGAIYGLRSAAQMPPEAWEAVLGAAGPAASTEQLWSLAVLDAEPGGPLPESPKLRQLFEDWYGTALSEDDTLRLAALDALLGIEGGRSIDWARYSSHAAELKLQNSQWIALLRHAEAAQWSAMFKAVDTPEGNNPPLFEAAASAAPAGFLPAGAREKFVAVGVDLEYDALAFAAGKTETIGLSELTRLLDLFALSEGQMQPAGSESDLARLLRFTRYAAMRNDQQSLNLLVSRIMSVGEDQASGILATIERYGPQALSDTHLQMLCDSRDRTVGYWLLFGWADRKPVQESSIVRLVWLSPNRENRMLFQAYSRWLEQEGIIKPAAPGA